MTTPKHARKTGFFVHDFSQKQTQTEWPEFRNHERCWGRTLLRFSDYSLKRVSLRNGLAEVKATAVGRTAERSAMLLLRRSLCQGPVLIACGKEVKS